MYKLLLINPVARKAGLGAHKSSLITPLALAYVAALTPDSYRIQIIDENIESFDYPDADIVGITSYTAHVSRAYEIADYYREQSIPVVMGGIHVSMIPDEAVQYCDAVVIGEAESVWGSVISDFEKKSLKSKYFGEQIPLSEIPYPMRSLLKNEKYLWGSVLTSKGCPMNCNFCSVTRFNGNKFRRRPVADVIQELMEIKNKLVMILDDNLLGYDDKEWLHEFFDAIRKKGIKKYFFAQASLKFGEDRELVKLAYSAGLRLLLIGIESVEGSSLNHFNKKLNENYVKNDMYFQLIRNIRTSGVTVLGSFILGCDDDNLKTFGKTLEFIKSSRIDVLQLTKPTPLPGTKFYQELDHENRILDKNYPDAWQDYRFTSMLFIPEKLTIEDVHEGFYYVRSEYYKFPAKIRRTFYSLIDTKSITSAVIAFIFSRTYEKGFHNSEKCKRYKNYDQSYLCGKFK